MRSLSTTRNVIIQRWSCSHHCPWRFSSSTNAVSTRIYSSKEAPNVQTKPSRRKWLGLKSISLLASGSAAFTLLYALSDISEPSTLNPQTFSSFNLESKETISSTSSIFTLKTSSALPIADPWKDTWKQGLWSVQIKQPQLQIARAYTPLPPIEGGIDDFKALRFLIRHNTHGEVSTYLHKLPLHATIDLRGPRLEYMIPEEVDEILFLAGGTGIAPALQAAHTVFEIRENQIGRLSPKMHIMWANRTEEDCAGATTHKDITNKNIISGFFRGLSGRSHEEVSITQETQNTPTSPLVQHLSTLQESHHPNLQVSYFIDSKNTYITPTILNQHLHPPPPPPAAFQDSTKQRNQGQKLILISGPDGFVDYLAGPKQWQGGLEVQGPLGGVLGKMDLGGWKVWKL